MKRHDLPGVHGRARSTSAGASAGSTARFRPSAGRCPVVAVPSQLYRTVTCSSASSSAGASGGPEEERPQLAPVQQPPSSSAASCPVPSSEQEQLRRVQQEVARLEQQRQLAVAKKRLRWRPRHDPLYKAAAAYVAAAAAAAAAAPAEPVAAEAPEVAAGPATTPVLDPAPPPPPVPPPTTPPQEQYQQQLPPPGPPSPPRPPPPPPDWVLASLQRQQGVPWDAVPFTSPPQAQTQWVPPPPQQKQGAPQQQQQQQQQQQPPPPRAPPPEAQTVTAASYMGCSRALALSTVERLRVCWGLTQSASQPDPQQADVFTALKKPSAFRLAAARQREDECAAALRAMGLKEMAPNYCAATAAAATATPTADAAAATGGGGGAAAGAAGHERPQQLLAASPSMSFTEFLGQALQLRRGEKAFAREVKLVSAVGGDEGGSSNGMMLSGAIDFLVLLWEPEDCGDAGGSGGGGGGSSASRQEVMLRPRLHVIECKDTSRQRSVHEVQALLYRMMVQQQLAEMRQQQLEPKGGGGATAATAATAAPVPGDGGEWLLGELWSGEVTCEVLRDTEQGVPEPPLVAPPLDPRKEEAAVMEHLRGEVQRLWEEGRRAVKAGTEEAFVREQPYMWNSGCSSCSHRPYCAADTAVRGAVQVLGLSTADNRRLREAGLDTVWDVARLQLDGPAARQLLRLGLSTDLSLLRDSARAWAATLPPPPPAMATLVVSEQQHGAAPAAGVQLRSVPGASTLPPWRGAEATPLVRVFLVLSYDDVRHTYNSLAAHVTCSQRELYTPRAGDWAKALRSGPQDRSLLVMNERPDTAAAADVGSAAERRAAELAADRALVERFLSDVFAAVEQVASTLPGGAAGKAASAGASPPPHPPLRARLHFYLDNSSALKQLAEFSRWSSSLGGGGVGSSSDGGSGGADTGSTLDAFLTLLGRRAGPEGEQPMVSYLQEEWGRQMAAGVAGSNRWQLTAQRWETEAWKQKKGMSTTPFHPLNLHVPGMHRTLPQFFGLESSQRIAYNPESRRLLPHLESPEDDMTQPVAVWPFELKLQGMVYAPDPDHFANYRAALARQRQRQSVAADVEGGAADGHTSEADALALALPLLLEQEPWQQRWMFERLNPDWDMRKEEIDLRAALRPSPPRTLPDMLADWVAIDFSARLHERRKELMQVLPRVRHQSSKSVMVSGMRKLMEEDWRGDRWLEPQVLRLQGKGLYLCDVEELEDGGGTSSVASQQLAFEGGDFVRVHPRSTGDQHAYQSSRDIRNGFDAIVEAVEPPPRVEPPPGQQRAAPRRRRILLTAFSRNRQSTQSAFIFPSSPANYYAHATLDESGSDYVGAAVHAALTGLDAAKRHHLDELVLQGALAAPRPSTAEADAAVRLLLDELQRTEAGTGKQLPAAVAGAGAAGGGGAGPSVLSAEQAEVVMAGLSSGLQVVQGPPGTGKTQLLAASLLLRCHHLSWVASAGRSAAQAWATYGSAPPAGRLVVLVAPTNAAADVAADRLAALAPYVSLAAERVRAQQPQQGSRKSTATLLSTLLRIELVRLHSSSSAGAQRLEKREAAAAITSSSGSSSSSSSRRGVAGSVGDLDWSAAFVRSTRASSSRISSSRISSRAASSRPSSRAYSTPAQPLQPQAPALPAPQAPVSSPVAHLHQMAASSAVTRLRTMLQQGSTVVVVGTVNAALKLSGLTTAALFPGAPSPLALLALDETSMMTSAQALALMGGLFPHQQPSATGSASGAPAAGGGGGTSPGVQVLAVGDPKQLKPITTLDARTELRPEVAARPHLAGSAYELLATVPGGVRSAISETNRFGPVTALLLTPMYEEDGIRLQASRRALALQEQQRQAQAQAEAEAEAPERRPQQASSRGGIRSSAALRRAPVLALESAREVLARVWSSGPGLVAPDELALVVHDEVESDKANELEAQIVRELLWSAPAGVLLPPGSVGIATLRSGQKQLLQAAGARGELEPPANRGALRPEQDIATVHSYQGGERRVMILSFCTSAPDRLDANDEFYINPNLFTVMLSRHKSQLVLVVGRKVLSHLHPDAQVKARLGLLRRARELASRPLGAFEMESGGGDTIGKRHRVEVFGICQKALRRLQ